MKCYQEITLIDQAEISPYFLWSKIYTQLHIAFAEQTDEQQKIRFGVSFPQYVYEKIEGKKSRIGIGKKIRIFAQSEAALETLNIRKWLDRFPDYVHITGVRLVPEKVMGYAVYKRKQVKTNAERLARHRVKRGDIGFDEALSRYRQVVSTTDLPYVQMLSLSTADEQDKKRFKLFIEKQMTEKSETQVFSTYGLSSMSTVPEF